MDYIDTEIWLKIIKHIAKTKYLLPLCLVCKNWNEMIKSSDIWVIEVCGWHARFAYTEFKNEYVKYIANIKDIKLFRFKIKNHERYSAFNYFLFIRQLLEWKSFSILNLFINLDDLLNIFNLIKNIICIEQKWYNNIHKLLKQHVKQFNLKDKHVRNSLARIRIFNSQHIGEFSASSYDIKIYLDGNNHDEDLIIGICKYVDKEMISISYPRNCRYVQIFDNSKYKKTINDIILKTKLHENTLLKVLKMLNLDTVL